MAGRPREAARQDETEIQFRLSGKRSLLSNGANGTSGANADANGDANTPE
jgi:hypothetical protein